MNPMNMIENKGSDDTEQLSKNNEVKVSGIIEDLKVRKSSLHKYVDYFETESDKGNMVDMSDDKDSAERDEISRNDA